MLAIVCLSIGTGCTTTGKGQQTADGQKIPGKKFFQIAEYEYICEPTLGQDHTEIEHQLDRFGANGWRLAGFMQKNGDTTAFCMMR